MRAARAGSRGAPGGLHRRLTQEEGIEAAYCRQAALDAARSEPTLVRMSSEAAHVLRVERAPLGDTFAVAEPDERRQIARVALIGVCRESPLAGEIAPESGEPLERGGGHRCPVSGGAFAAERVGHQLREAGQELGAHARVKAIAVGASEREESERALLAERHESDGSELEALGAEEELAL